MDLEFRGGELAAPQGRSTRKLGQAHLRPSQLDCRQPRARLASKLEEAYGVTSNEAERQIKSFEARNQYPRPVSFR